MHGSGKSFTKLHIRWSREDLPWLQSCAFQKVCATPSNPININIHAARDRDGAKAEKGAKGDPGMKGEKGDSGTTSCKCLLQDPKKPSAHIEGANKEDVTYQVNKVIKDWTLKAPYSHLAGGMKYHDGKLTVPIPGRYYIYEQIYYRGYRGKPVRISILVNNKVVAMVQPSIQIQLKADFALSTGGVFILKAGDVITVAATRIGGIAYMYTYHSFFGAFLI
ncbi:tumor necrosis factor ligand superfamily member 15-like isoform X2 [Oculina patagonica]